MYVPHKCRHGPLVGHQRNKSTGREAEIFTPNYGRGYELLELYLHSSTCLHSMVPKHMDFHTVTVKRNFVYVARCTGSAIKYTCLQVSTYDGLLNKFNEFLLITRKSQVDFSICLRSF